MTKSNSVNEQLAEVGDIIRVHEHVSDIPAGEYVVVDNKRLYGAKFVVWIMCHGNKLYVRHHEYTLVRRAETNQQHEPIDVDKSLSQRRDDIFRSIFG